MRSNKVVWRDKWKGRIEPVNGFAKKLVKVCGQDRGRALLDVGCGNGQDSRFFARKRFQVTAVDFSRSGIEALNESLKIKGIKSVRSLLCDLTQKLPFNNEEFDIIYAHLALHYFDDKTTRRVFDELGRLLKPGGLFFVKCKSTKDSLYGKGERVRLDMYYFVHTRHFFSKEYLASLLKVYEKVSIRCSSASYQGKKSAFVEAIARKAVRDKQHNSSALSGRGVARFFVRRGPKGRC